MGPNEWTSACGSALKWNSIKFALSSNQIKSRKLLAERLWKGCKRIFHVCKVLQATSCFRVPLAFLLSNFPIQFLEFRKITVEICWNSVFLDPGSETIEPDKLYACSHPLPQQKTWEGGHESFPMCSQVEESQWEAQSGKEGSERWESCQSPKGSSGRIQDTKSKVYCQD